MRRMAALIVILFGVAATSAWAQDKGTVRFAYLRLDGRSSGR